MFYPQRKGHRKMESTRVRNVRVILGLDQGAAEVELPEKKREKKGRLERVRKRGYQRNDKGVKVISRTVPPALGKRT